MSEDDSTNDSTPPVACTIANERAVERASWMRDDLVPAYVGYGELDDGVVVRFSGTDETLAAVARFVAEEKRCCAFADYRVDVSPPYEETRLTITGPEGTKALFGDEFVGRLSGEEPMEPPG